VKPRQAFIVLDLGFGDSGKGLLTDALARREDADLIVRFNGGAQAGHRVCTSDGREHIFSQFGAGLLAGNALSLYGPECVFHPTALVLEAGRMETIGVHDPLSRIRVSDACRVITPYHQAAGRLRELARGRGRHGSCGIGLGETVGDSLTHPELSLRAGDLLKGRRTLQRKLAAIREAKILEIESFRTMLQDHAGAGAEFEIFDRDEPSRNWVENIECLSAPGLIVSPQQIGDIVSGSRCMIFEGAQGILLDENRGFHPHTTWSDCTAHHAMSFISRYCPDAAVQRWGVLRAYSLRHGPGPLPAERGPVISCREDHNCENSWQGVPRTGDFDAVLARYALRNAGSIDRFLLTHLDTVSTAMEFRSVRAYLPGEAGMPEDFVASRNDDGEIEEICLPFPGVLSRQEELGAVLLGIKLLYAACEARPEKIVSLLEGLLGRRIDAISQGPIASDIVWR